MVKRKYTKEQLYKMEAVEIYKLVLKGDLKQFPSGFWELPEAKDNAKKVFKFLIHNILNWTIEDIKTKLIRNVFSKYKLSGMIELVFDNSVYKVVNHTFPNELKPWELHVTPYGYWNNETAREATRWLIEEVLHYDDKQIKNDLNFKIFKEHKLGGMMEVVYNKSVFYAINDLYPNRFKQWEFRKVSISFWNKETGIEAVKWLVEERLKWNDEKLKEKLCTRVFNENGLRGMLNVVFNSSTYNAFNTAYPNRFKPWEFAQVPKSYWTDETITLAVKWLIEDKLKWNEEQVKNNLTSKVFFENNLVGLLTGVLKSSVYKALDIAYPNKYKEMDLKGYQRKYGLTERNN